MPLSQQLSARELKALYENKYADEKLVKIQRDVVELKDVRDQHGWVVGGFQVHSQGDRAVVVVGATPCCIAVFSKPNHVSFFLGWFG
jgi:N-acetyl-gamma-glutamyl-phosphate reductase/acetylglutamate kinase